MSANLFIIGIVNRISVLALLAIALPMQAQFSSKTADATVPIVASTAGQSNAHFKSEVQLTNGSEDAMSGWLHLRPHDIFKRYELAAHATIAFADVVAEMGAAGAGSLDVLVDEGTLPTIVVRAYDDQPAGTTGVTVPALRPEDILTRNDVRSLIVPAGLGPRFRFNVGVRAMDEGVMLELTVFDATGNERHFRTLQFPSHHFEQQPGSVVAAIDLQPNDSIRVKIAAGSGIIYATSVDNATNDSAMQVLRK
jgi:hypothetical protein